MLHHHPNNLLSALLLLPPLLPLLLIIFPYSPVQTLHYNPIPTSLCTAITLPIHYFFFPLSFPPLLLFLLLLLLPLNSPLLLLPFLPNLPFLRTQPLLLFPKPNPHIFPLPILLHNALIAQHLRFFAIRGT
ncbi:unnamed protein product [Periconia digitata]|uniref:Uncharacterized protein n=1 Tax=Periconia digitata TaxID=1303443 RepID=A0A9W4XQ78_9PLEO|nr:unnamed protein product [Periconia digitata]